MEQDKNKNGHLPRYCVGREGKAWAVYDRRKSYEKESNAVGTFTSRERARMKARQLNTQEQPDQTSTPTGDAAA